MLKLKIFLITMKIIYIGGGTLKKLYKKSFSLRKQTKVVFSLKNIVKSQAQCFDKTENVS